MNKNLRNCANFLKDRWHDLLGKVSIGFIVIVIIFAYTPLVNFIAKPLIIPPTLEKADSALVLSGGVYPNGALSYFTSERIIRAVSLYKDGLVSKIILSGGVSLGNKDIHDADAMKQVALSLGVLEKDIILENQSRNTYENLTFSKKIIEENKFNNVLLVTSAIHTRRSLKISQSIGLNLIPASPTPFEDYRSMPIDRLLLAYFTIREYGALLFYNLVY